ncbi:sigma 54-interacting transcriptional regulator [Thalassotalea crassostreae]|uniref:sigma 54-interacting transcriptional regulator n=1 Tax=Thalassotalea crassostreae TaxID=1763536 RepID=UPI0008381A8D|nr:sigma 54-interacting transcriptional regulator [Thalassotalea crassostreae]
MTITKIIKNSDVQANKHAYVYGENEHFGKLLDLLATLGYQVKVLANLNLSFIDDNHRINGHLLFIDNNLLAEQSIDKSTLCQSIDGVVYIVNNHTETDLESNLENQIEENTKSIYTYLNLHQSVEQISALIKFGIYKSNFSKTHIQQNNLLTQAVDCISDYVIYLDDTGAVTALSNAAQVLFDDNEHSLIDGAPWYIGQPWYKVINSREDLTSQHSQQFIAAAIKVNAVTKLQPIAIKTISNSSVLVDGIIGPIKQRGVRSGSIIMLRKLTSLDNLPKVLELKPLTHKNANEESRVSGILLFSPDDFNKINLKYGREVGDQVLYQIGKLLRNFVRPSDMTSHYGGTMFLLMFSSASEEQIVNITNKLRELLNEYRFNQQSLNLKFSFGLAVNNEHINYSPIELFYFANFSLSQAGQSGGNRLEKWLFQNTLQQIGNLDKLSGKVTQTGDQDYQKMLMQWNILNNLNTLNDKGSFIEQILKHCLQGFDLESAAFFNINDGCYQLSQAIDKNGKAQTNDDVSFSENQLSYLNSICENNEYGKVFTSMVANGGLQVVVPIRKHDQISHFLYFITQQDNSVRIHDHHVLLNIADFIALTLKRLNPKSSTSSSLLSNGDNFWYQSKNMHQLMSEVKMVAPTSATVLITGESGTGKEVLAKNIHQHSNRKDKPFIIFDCGTVVDNLIESELFGHTKGAFTGADKKSEGSVAKADGGTLFLDEIGELPLDMQVKLLRFVQEKQYSAVGSGELKKVDVRIVAATNVNLKEKIKQGLFREDLYFRLDVFNIKNIALRDRIEDIVLIAESYLHVYAEEYDKVILGISDEAKQALIEYQWPGNIRELKNLVHKAVILCQQNQLSCEHIGLYPAIRQPSNQHSLNRHHSFMGDSYAIEQVQNSAGLSSSIDSSKLMSDKGNKLSYFKDQTANSEEAISAKSMELVKLCISHQSSIKALTPIAPWVEFLLYKKALVTHNDIALQASNSLNIAESTFRRRWKKLQTAEEPQQFKILQLSYELADLILEEEGEFSKINRMNLVLANHSLEAGLTMKLASTLLDVSVPTLRKLVNTPVSEVC